MTLVAASEILDLINEVGHVIELGTVTKLEPDHRIGFGSRSDITWRRVSGYVTPANFKEMGIKNPPTAAGGAFTAYILGQDITPPLPPETVMRWGEHVMQVTYLQPIMSQGTVMLHKLLLTITQETRQGMH